MKRGVILAVAMGMGMVDGWAQSGAIAEPLYLGEPCTHEGTNLLQDRDGSLQFTFRKGSNSWHGGPGFSDEVYQISTLDCGKSWSDTTVVLTMPVGSGYFATISPTSGEMIFFYKAADGTARYIRTDDSRTTALWDRELSDKTDLVGVGGGYCEWIVMPDRSRRLIVGSHRDNKGVTCYLSDDDGRTFVASQTVKVPNEIPHIWQTGCVEPAILELNDGRIWMLLRTSNDRLWECFSADQGQTWSEPTPSRFKAGPNSWVSLRRLKNGDIAIFWNNARITDPVVTDDQWNFTNRDVLCVALSSDQGATWRGFRELWRDNLRNGNFVNYPGDKGLNESKVAQAADGSVLVATGQAPGHRSFIRLDPRWVDLDGRQDDFALGIDGWSVQSIARRPPTYSTLYHYNYNRRQGATVIAHPSKPGKNVLKVAKKTDSALYSARQGAVWNFPAGVNGELKLKIRFNRTFGGVSIALTDVWAQPTSDAAAAAAPYLIYIPPTMEYGEATFDRDKWYELTLKWRAGELTVEVEGKVVKKIEKKCEYLNGLCYLRLRNEAVGDDPEGIYVEKVEVKTNNNNQKP